MKNVNNSGNEYSVDKEIGRTSELKESDEIKKIGEPPQASEMGNTERLSPCKQNKTNNSRILKALQSFVIGGVALVAVGAATIFPSADKPSVNIGEVKAFDTYAEYSVSVEDTGSTELNLVIYNDYYKSERPVLAGETSGIVEGLTPNQSYTIAIKGNFGFGESTLSNKTFRTFSTEQVPRTRLNGIETACTCGVDGKFNFKLIYEDDNDYWSDFSAVLETTDGSIKVSFCEFSSDYSEWQYFDVSNLSRGDYRLTITVVSRDPKDRETPVNTLYSGEVQI